MQNCQALGTRIKSPCPEPEAIPALESPAIAATFPACRMTIPRSIALLLALPLAGRADDFANKATPLLSKYCFECHGEKTQKGGIEVHQLNSADAALRHHRFLENIAEQVESGDMPPDDEDVLPTDAERKQLVDEIRSVLKKLESGNFPRNPGRTTGTTGATIGRIRPETCVTTGTTGTTGTRVTAGRAVSQT